MNESLITYLYSINQESSELASTVIGMVRMRQLRVKKGTPNTLFSLLLHEYSLTPNTHFLLSSMPFGRSHTMVATALLRVLLSQK